MATKTQKRNPQDATLRNVRVSREAERNLTMTLNAVLVDRKSTRLNSSHIPLSRMPSSA